MHVFSVPRQLIKPFTSDTVTVISNLAKLSRLEQDCLLGWTLEESQQRAFADPSQPPSPDDVMRRLYHLIRQERPHFMERVDPRDFGRRNEYVGECRIAPPRVPLQALRRRLLSRVGDALCGWL